VLFWDSVTSAAEMDGKLSNELHCLLFKLFSDKCIFDAFDILHKLLSLNFSNAIHALISGIDIGSNFLR